MSMEGQSTVIMNTGKLNTATISNFLGLPKINTDFKLIKNIRTGIHLKYIFT